MLSPEQVERLRVMAQHRSDLAGLDPSSPSWLETRPGQVIALCSTILELQRQCAAMLAEIRRERDTSLARAARYEAALQMIAGPDHCRDSNGDAMEPETCARAALNEVKPC